MRSIERQEKCFQHPLLNFMNVIFKFIITAEVNEKYHRSIKIYVSTSSYIYKSYLLNLNLTKLFFYVLIFIVKQK